MRDKYYDSLSLPAAIARVVVFVVVGGGGGDFFVRLLDELVAQSRTDNFGRSRIFENPDPKIFLCVNNPF